MITRRLYSTRCIDTTPNRIYKERRTRRFRRFMHHALELSGMVLWMLVIIFMASEVIYLYGSVPR